MRSSVTLQQSSGVDHDDSSVQTDPPTAARAGSTGDEPPSFDQTSVGAGWERRDETYAGPVEARTQMPPSFDQTSSERPFQLTPKRKKAIEAVRFIAAHLKNEDDYAEVTSSLNSTPVVSS